MKPTSQRREYYASHAAEKKKVAKDYYVSHAAEKKKVVKDYYASHTEERKEDFKAYHASHAEERKQDFKAYHASHIEERQQYFAEYYASHCQQIKEAHREHYPAVANFKNAKLRQKYHLNSKQINELCRSIYKRNTWKKKAAARALAQAKCIKMIKRQQNKKYYRKNANKITENRRARYALKLGEPSYDKKHKYISQIRAGLAKHNKVQMQLNSAFNNVDVPTRVIQSGINLMASRRIVNLVLGIRKQYAGLLLGVIKKVKSVLCINEGHFGEKYHTAGSMPYYYQECFKNPPLCDNDVNDKENDNEITDEKGQNKTVKLPCTDNCKQLTESEIKTIVELKEAFSKDVDDFRQILQDVDSGCPHKHEADKQGHPLICYEENSGCTSSLRILRAASPHYPKLRTFLRNVYDAMKFDRKITAIDVALTDNDIDTLIKITTRDEDEVNISKILSSEGDGSSMSLRDPDIEARLIKDNIHLIAQYEKEISDQNENVCCSCRRLLRRKNMTEVKGTDKIRQSQVWKELEMFLTQYDPSFSSKALLICNHCKPQIRSNKMPARCVLNNLQCEPLPDELKNLDPLSSQLIQLAKCYQTVVRLGTYTAKVPTYNSLKASKGSMFFLPLPLDKTMSTLGNAQDFRPKSLPDPELYVIVNGQPTKNKTIWRTLVDVNSVKAAFEKLKEINWLYGNLDNNESLDDVSKKVVEVANSATSTMIEEATDEDIVGFQSYTIRNMNSKLSKDSDIAQYKLNSVREDPLDNRQLHLDVMCFPTLFPTGRFGEHHYRKVKLTPAEYVKSRLLNEVSIYRKHHLYVFYLLRQKELRELKAGIFKVMNTKKGGPMSAAQFMAQVDNSSDHLESNLCNMMQSLRGTNQYWYLRRSELKCMIAEYGSPTFFLTFSCAEYYSADIKEYLLKANDVPPSYNIGRLCTEDPISVSRQFSLKFHEFFNKIIINGRVLGQVDQFYWKEYQACGAPHYHALVWICNAPVIGVSKEEDVIKFIDDRITCHIPKKDSCPELYNLVTKYQMHKCSNYCKRKRKFSSNTFITKCKFGFPRPASDKTVINNVKESMKAEKKIYHVKRDEEEVRINDYNPLILLLWKANVDIQFVSESSLALADYVSGYVTKAEKSHLQDIWQEVSSDKTLYGRLFSFGLRCLSTREVGLYEASDILLGDSLYRKSVTVQYIDVSMPHKRSRKLKAHEELKTLAKDNPNSEDIYSAGLVTDFYPTRPNELKKLCLYDFVANYVFNGLDKNGKRSYRKLDKPRLPNFKLFDPQKEEQRDSYFYALILLFVPFTNEDDLIQDGETVEEAFNRHTASNDRCSEYHQKLTIILEVQSNLKDIKDARAANKDDDNDKMEDDEPQLMGQIKDAMNDVNEMDSGSTLTLQQRESMLNADQKRIFDNVKSHLLNQLEYEKKSAKEKEKCQQIKPLHMFISGVGGTGKSFLIEAIKALVRSLWPSSKQTCAVAAPTGLAAYNVGGVTAHRLFQLPIEHEGKPANYWSLSKASHKVMKTALQELKMVIIDEVSMVSSLNLTYIHMRLNDIFESTEWFGGKNVLFVGDILQLPPVNGSPVFAEVTQAAVKYRIGSMGAINIWQDIVLYDELTINERQKTDQTFSDMLDCVRRGIKSDETISTLSQRVIKVPIEQKFDELQEAGCAPVCLFPTREACNDFNNKMLQSLSNPVKEIPCCDLVDESGSMRKWNKKTAEHLEKLNKDLNNTAGLEALLKLAVGARVMLRCNVKVEEGLVNGALGTVLAIAATRITIKFDKISKPCEIEKVKRKFMVMKNFYVYRSQFPLILAFAVTIHKSQGLSLDNAIIDLSDRVFSPGMAYVALSRVRTLSGVHLTAFEPSSIIADESCIKEINRLRRVYRPDLPQYTIPDECGSRKRKLTGKNVIDEPDSKKQKRMELPKVKRGKRNRSPVRKSDKNGNSTKKSRTDNVVDDDVAVTAHYGPGTARQNYIYHPPNAETQRSWCRALNLRYVKAYRPRLGSPTTPLTAPLTDINIPGDGNCLFNALSLAITGSTDQQGSIRAAIINHMNTIENRLVGHWIPSPPYFSVREYIEDQRMDHDGIWGTDVETITMANLLKTTIYSYDVSQRAWFRYQPHNGTDVNTPGIYLHYVNSNHYRVVKSIL